MSMPPNNLRASLLPYLDADLPAPVGDAAARIAARFPNTEAVLFYGSCLRTGRVDGQMLDFYVLVDDYDDALGSFFKAFGNRFIPPNVFYFEEEIEDVTIRAKFALLSVAHFLKLCSQETFNPAIWARFAQPVALPWHRSAKSKTQVMEGLEAALVTTVETCRPLVRSPMSERDFWAFCFAQTYRTELRAESAARPAHLYDLMADFYQSVSPHLLPDIYARRCADGDLHFETDRSAYWNASWAWFWRRIQGKLLHVLRLIKGAATFDGGIDYLAWKIERHSGMKITLKPWHRKYPVLAGLWILPRLRRKGAVK